MKDQIEKLISYGKLDFEIHEIQSQLEDIPQNLRLLEETWQQAKLAHDSQNTLLIEKETLLHSLQQEFATDRDKTNEKEARLHQIKTQKEFQAITKEIADTKRINHEKETKINQLTQEVEPLKTVVAELKTKLDAAWSVYSQEKESFSEIQNELSNKITEILEKKRAIEIKPALLSKYERIYKVRKPALSQVASGSCNECNIRVSPQVINLMRLQPDLYTCANCGRILYLA